MCADKIGAAAALAGVSIQALESSYNVTCLVHIDNDTKWKMANPRLLINNGSIATPPGVIKAKSEGFIASHKTAFSIMGVGATITWDLEGLEAKIEIDYGIAGGGYSWMNPNHLQLRLVDAYGKELCQDKRYFKSGSVCVPSCVTSQHVKVEGTMGNTDHARIMISISEQ